MGPAYAAYFELPHFLMERKMLLGIKERAERAAAQKFDQLSVGG